MKTNQKENHILPIKIVSAGEAQAASGNAIAGVIGFVGLLLELVGLVVVARFVFDKAKKRFAK